MLKALSVKVIDIEDDEVMVRMTENNYEVIRVFPQLSVEGVTMTPFI